MEGIVFFSLHITITALSAIVIANLLGGEAEPLSRLYRGDGGS
jgi:hypothetical protein